MGRDREEDQRQKQLTVTVEEESGRGAQADTEYNAVPGGEAENSDIRCPDSGQVCCIHIFLT